MEIRTKYMTQNDCYKTGRKITPKGIMVHSTATPGVMAESWFARWNKSGISKCVHAFVDDTVIMQYLPWNHRGWHAGGYANNTHIGFEICEPSGFSYSGGATMVGYDVTKNQEYFDAIYKNAVELTAYLCKMYGLTEKNVICHSEGHQLGIASGHADVMHWFPKHGKSMDTFRADVKNLLETGEYKVSNTYTVTVTDKMIADGKEYIGDRCLELQNKLISAGYDLPKYGADGDFGRETCTALVQFQHDYGLVEDALAGTKTFAKLDEVIAKKNAEKEVVEDPVLEDTENQTEVSDETEEPTNELEEDVDELVEDLEEVMPKGLLGVIIKIIKFIFELIKGE